MLMYVCDTCSGRDDVRGMEAEWFADASCDRQWNDARLLAVPFPDQRASAYCSSELSWIHHWRAWGQQWYVMTSAVISTQCESTEMWSSGHGLIVDSPGGQFLWIWPWPGQSWPSC